MADDAVCSYPAYNKSDGASLDRRNDWENSNPNWINNEQLTEEYAQISNKIYQELDETKHRAELIKEVIIPK